MEEIKVVSVSDIKFRPDLYPRVKHDPMTVQKYAEDLDVLPPIEINQNGEIIDGFHRWTAHKKNGATTIKAIVTETASESHFLELAIEKNSAHGLQLSSEDKMDMARKIYHMTPEKERKGKKEFLAKILSVSGRLIADWLSRIDKDTKESRNKRIFGLWMACHTHEEIAAKETITKETSSEVCQKNAELQKSDKSLADHSVDFETPIYNVWKFKAKSEGSKHFGNSESTIVDNLLYLHTKPFDVVVDPFAGGGSTIEVCKKRFRRYFVSDRKPIIERENEIRKHDLTDGLPELPRWKDVSLVYLDPPYWKQAENQYSEDHQDLANMSIEEFNKTLIGTVHAFAKKLTAGAHIALIIQPTQWKAPDRRTVDHVADLIKAVKLPIIQRISCPYESQQCNAQMVEWAKENKSLLVLTREVIVWEIV